MDQEYEESVLADAISSDEEREYAKEMRGESEGKGGRAESSRWVPSVNTSKVIRARGFLRRIFVDSRDRDIVHFPRANDFKQSLSVPIKGIRSVTLTDARIPILANQYYVSVCLRNVKDRTLILPKESGGLPGGCLAVIPLIPAVPGANYAYYRSQTGQINGGSGVGWRISVAQGMRILSDVHLQLWAWGGSPGTASVLYPLSAELGPPPNIDLNVTFTLEIEHDIS